MFIDFGIKSPIELQDDAMMLFHICVFVFCLVLVSKTMSGIVH